MQRALALITHHSARLRRVAAGWSKVHATLLIRSRGRLGGSWFGAPMLVLVTTGRRTGKVRQTPLLYARDGDAYILLAANAGNDRPPAWWLNLTAAETAEVLVGGRRRTMRWREIGPGPDYDRLLAALIATYPPGRHYRGFTDRHLPIVALTDPA